VNEGSSFIEGTFGKGIGWYLDRSFIRGTGAGQPLGIINAPATITVDKETAQEAGTLLYENFTGMLAQMNTASIKNSVWVISPSCIKQLLELVITIGAGGEHVKVMKEVGGGFQILTRPVIFSEHCAVLGTVSDVILADFSQYIIGMKPELRFESSIHKGFVTDESAFRMIARVDGQPGWDEKMILADGSTEVSPFLMIETRSA